MKNLKKTLAEYGLTQGEFAALVGVSRMTVNKWCADNPSSPSVHIAPKVERVLERLKKLHVGRRLPSAPMPSTARLERLRTLVGAAAARC